MDWLASNWDKVLSALAAMSIFYGISTWRNQHKGQEKIKFAKESYIECQELIEKIDKVRYDWSDLEFDKERHEESISLEEEDDLKIKDFLINENLKDWLTPVEHAYHQYIFRSYKTLHNRIEKFEEESQGRLYYFGSRETLETRVIRYYIFSCMRANVLVFVTLARSRKKHLRFIPLNNNIRDVLEDLHKTLPGSSALFNDMNKGEQGVDVISNYFKLIERYSYFKHRGCLHGLAVFFVFSFMAKFYELNFRSWFCLVSYKGRREFIYVNKHLFVDSGRLDRYGLLPVKTFLRFLIRQVCQKLFIVNAVGLLSKGRGKGRKLIKLYMVNKLGK